MAMTCDDIQAMLDREGGLTTGEARDHVHQCPACQEAWARWQAVQRELRAMGEEETPPFLHTRLMAHLQSAAHEGDRKGAWMFGLNKIWAGPIFVLFLGLLLGGFGLVQMLKPKVPAPAAEVSKRPVHQEARAAKGEPSGDEGRTSAKSLNLPTSEPAPSPAPPEIQHDFAGLAAPPVVSEQSRAREAPSLFAPAPAQETAGQEPYRPLSNRPAEASQEGRIEAAPDPGATSRAARAEMAAPPSEDQAPASVVCTLSPLSGPGPFISLQLPSEASPPSGGIWTILLSPGGALRVQDVQGKAVTAPERILQEIIHPLHIPPGSYRLKRIS